MRVKAPDRIAAARRRRGYTQYDLAALAKCTQATISALETGTMRGCSEDLAKAICKWVDRDMEDLFERHDNTRVQRVTNAAGSTRKTVAA
ncbi:helix-turn-helix transcriptional regulator [Georgenia faecalis]|uniref:helix-turn-helix transcriptional regulator n=1 Tax=Georgenia faecalis TaxID=2483799 RepID=UPI0013E0AF12|nr:helix-turn-helix transcriptional regulator [Georgenia faecalis]